MKFPYKEFPQKDPTKPPWRRPYLGVRLSHDNKFVDAYCLVDSGADVCVMPASLGKLVGIDIESGREGEVSGIGAQPVTVYFHPVHITVLRLASLDLEAAFGYSIRYGILGQSGFFDRFKVIFERQRNVIDIIDTQAIYKI